MIGEERRNQIIKRLSQDTPISGTAIAKEFDVSRQVVVQDIALLRTAGYDIISTHRGYLLNHKKSSQPERVFKCQHADDQTEAELQLIVDQGGVVVNVSVNHKVYGSIEAPLYLRSRRDIAAFMGKIDTGKSSLLMNVTSGYHYHKVSAESEEVLDIIEDELQNHGFLVNIK